LELKDLRKFAKYPKQFINMKAVKGQICEKAEALRNAEVAAVRKALAPSAPENLTVIDFLKLAKFESERAAEIAPYFTDFQDLISASERELSRIHTLAVNEQRKILKYIVKFKAGLFPPSEPPAFAEPQEPKQWTTEEDKALLAACERFGADFGDPWIYVSHALGRNSESVRERFLEISEIPKNKTRTCELALTVSARSLLFNRDFKILPPKLFLVPTEGSFPLHPLADVPSTFQKYRDPSVF